VLLASGCLVYGTRVETFPELRIAGTAFDADGELLAGCTITFLVPSRPVFAGGAMMALHAENPLEGPHTGVQAVVAADGQFSCVLPERKLLGEFQRWVSSNREKYFPPENMVMFSTNSNPDITYLVHIVGENATIRRVFLDDGGSLHTEQIEGQEAAVHIESGAVHNTLVLRLMF